MESAPNLLAPQPANSALLGRRLHHRQKISTLAYVNLDYTNGGIIRNLSEAGMAIQAVVPLRLNQQVYLRFDLLRPRLRVETVGRIAWADLRGRAGVQFLNLAERSRRQIKQWIFTQLLNRAHQFARTGLIFASSRPAEATDELLFSATPRPAIHLEPQENRLALPEVEDSPKISHLRWLPLAISSRMLSRLVDSLILVVAVLLFSSLAMILTHIVPRPPVGLALALVVTVVFAALYWFLFVVWIGATPGEHLAQLASRDSAGGLEEEDRPRFR